MKFLHISEIYSSIKLGDFMKKFVILLGTVLLLLFVSGITGLSAVADLKRPSEYRIGVPYSTAISSGKPAVVLFYADWCGVCRQFMPIFSSVYYANNKNYSFSMVNTDKNDALSNQYGIRGIPTVYIVDKMYNKQYKIPIKYYSSVNELTSILNEYLKRRR